MTLFENESNDSEERKPRIIKAGQQATSWDDRYEGESDEEYRHRLKWTEPPDFLK